MSLRARLLLVITVLTATYLIAATLVVRSLESELISQVDARLISLPVTAGSPPGNRFGNDTPPQQPETSTEIENPYSDFYIVFVTADGVIQPLVAGNLDSTDIDFSRFADSNLGDAGRVFSTISGESSGERYRVLTHGVGDQQGVVVAMQSLRDIDITLDQVRQTFVIAGAVIATVIVLAGFWVHRLGLQPIARVTAVAEAIAAGNTTQRVEVTDAAIEAGKLGHAFNLMLDERDETEQRLRQFIGDASHELRTPLTSIQGYLDLYQQGAFREPDQLDDVVRRLSSESSRMGAMVQDLLTLSRLDEHPEMRHERVNLMQIVLDAAMDARAVQPQREVVVMESVSPAVVTGDPAQLTQLVGVLVSNALAHTPATSQVSLAVTSNNTGVTLVVRDAGPGMDDQAVAHAFDRFWRGSESRMRVKGGSVGAGLGLSIAKSITEAHSGSISLESSPESGSVFTVQLPKPMTR
ncbi:MAG: HAMP domain-containing histidine kinase [Thermomicrobiales bacterium]|nr:HAMP domain-containing histidine kinase [Thermomicrobiales bacterium]